MYRDKDVVPPTVRDKTNNLVLFCFYHRHSGRDERVTRKKLNRATLDGII